MKVKKTKKRLFSLVLGTLILSMLMLCSALSVSVFAVGIDECVHDIGEDGWTVIKKATCSEVGSKTKWCKYCLENVIRTIPQDPSAHVPGEWVTVKTPDCISEGEEVLYCAYPNCQTELKRRSIPAHDYHVLFKQDATCMTEGYEFVACLRCYDMTTVETPIDTNAHLYSDWIVISEATCVEESGKRIRRCLCTDDDGVFCGAEDVEVYNAPENHTNIVWNEETKVAPTCFEVGYKFGECEGCKKTQIMELPLHSESESVELETIPSDCHNHGTQKRLCECGYEFVVELKLDPDNHVYGEWYTEKQPSCTPGKRVKYCFYHYGVDIEQEIPANGKHNFGEWVTVEEPTCSSTGLKERKCKDCSEKETEVLPTKHDLTKWTTVVRVSCNEDDIHDGVMLAECNECTYKDYFNIPSNHSFSPWGIVVEASCWNTGRAGTRQRVCSGCGKIETEAYYAQHNFSDWYVTGKSVCADTENGLSGRTGMYTRWCLTCKKTESRVIPVTHDFTEWEIITYPSCSYDEETGERTLNPGKRISKCNFCDEIKEEEIAVEHSYTEWKSVSGSSCKKVRECIICKITDEKCDHYWKDVDCASLTVGDVLTCKECGETATASGAHPNMKKVVIEPSCASTGYTRSYCPDCDGYDEISDIVPANGHQLDANWTTRIDPTCTLSGARYKACANCAYLEYQYIDKAEHFLITLEPGQDPTCTEKGYTARTLCTNCKEIFPSQEIPAAGHKYSEGSEICKVCNAYKESPNQSCTCACHSTNGMEKIFFDLINKLYSFFGINQYCKCGNLHYEEMGFFAKLLGKA